MDVTRVGSIRSRRRRPRGIERARRDRRTLQTAAARRCDAREEGKGERRYVSAERARRGLETSARVGANKTAPARTIGSRSTPRRGDPPRRRGASRETPRVGGVRRGDARHSRGDARDARVAARPKPEREASSARVLPRSGGGRGGFDSILSRESIDVTPIDRSARRRTAATGLAGATRAPAKELVEIMAAISMVRRALRLRAGMRPARQRSRVKPRQI